MIQQQWLKVYMKAVWVITWKLLFGVGDFSGVGN